MRKIIGFLGIDHTESFASFLFIAFKLKGDSPSIMKKIQLSPVAKFILGWLPLPGIAIFNGILRELTYSHVAGEQLAQQISSILLSLLVMLYVVLLNSRVQLKSLRDSIFVGLIWLILTIFFEIALGLAVGMTLHEQMESYNILKGNFWPLVLLSVFLSPSVFRRKHHETHVQSL